MTSKWKHTRRRKPVADPAAAHFVSCPWASRSSGCCCFNRSSTNEDAGPFAAVQGEAWNDNGKLRLRGDRVIALAKRRAVAGRYRERNGG